MAGALTGSLSLSLLVEHYPKRGISLGVGLSLSRATVRSPSRGLTDASFGQPPASRLSLSLSLGQALSLSQRARSFALIDSLSLSLAFSASRTSPATQQDAGRHLSLTVTGNVPSRIGRLSKLEILVLSDNSLSGEVPNFISRIRTLKRFTANQDSFTGAIPSGISSFLKNLDLSYNNLSGSMPNDLLMQPNLQTVDLSYNKLKGSIPGNVSSSLVPLRLGSNALHGSISPFNCAQLQNLMYLELENNLLSGNIPTHLGSCWNFDGHGWLECDYGKTFRVGDAVKMMMFNRMFTIVVLLKTLFDFDALFLMMWDFVDQSVDEKCLLLIAVVFMRLLTQEGG